MKKYIADVLEAEDGSGDQILQLSPEFCVENDWQENDVISFKTENNNIIMRNLSREERENLHKQIPLPLDQPLQDS